MKRLLTLATVILLSSCVSDMPLYQVADQPPEYRQGYQDGCSSGEAAGGNGWHRFTKNTSAYAHNQLYHQGWDDGVSFCHAQYISVINTFAY